jgi:Flp pilus assembly protein TadD
MKVLRSHIITCLIFLFSIITTCPSLAQENLPAIVKKIQPSVVTILTYDKNRKGLSQGSGFFIKKDGNIITNRHVLQGANSADVKTAEGKVYPVTRVIAEDREGDLILVSVDIPHDAAHPLSVSASIPEVGERVIVIGSPLGLEKTVSDGIVSAVRDIPEFGTIIQITAPISPGSSGSPVVNMQGQVIGVATLQTVEGQNLNFAVTGERIVKLKTGKEQRLAEWEEGRTKEWLASAEGLYSTGLSFLWAADYEKALYYFEQAIKKNPRYAEAHYNLGWVYGNLGRYTEAIEAFKQSIRIKPDFAEAYKNLGVAYGKLGRYTEEIEAYKKAIAIKPDYADAYFSLGLAYGSLRRYTEAIEVFKQSIRIKPDYAYAHFMLGTTYLQIGDRVSALEEYKILKTLDDDKANELFNMIYE